MPAPDKRHLRKQEPHGNLVFPETHSGVLRIERFIEPCILLLLAEQNRNGYGLRDELIKVGLATELDFAYLYRTLRRMERVGLVVSDWAEQRTAPSKRLYRITPEVANFWLPGYPVCDRPDDSSAGSCGFTRRRLTLGNTSCIESVALLRVSLTANSCP